MQLTWIRGRGLLAAIAILTALQGANHAPAQYVPRGMTFPTGVTEPAAQAKPSVQTAAATPTKGATSQAYPATGQPYNASSHPYTAPSQASTAPSQRYAAYTAPSQPYTAPSQAYTAPSQPYTAPSQAYTAPSQAYTPPTSTQPYAAPSQAYTVPAQQNTAAAQAQPPASQYPAIAYRTSPESTPVDESSLPTTPVDPTTLPTEGGISPEAGGISYQQHPQMVSYGSRYSAPIEAGYNGYGGYGADRCGNYNTFEQGCGLGSCGGCGLGCGKGARCGCGTTGACCPQNCGRRWFGGVYGLYMERARRNWVPLAFSTSTPGVGYYPNDTEYVMNLRDLNDNLMGGAEFRLGSTFLGRGCAPACGCAQFGWEFGYWGLVEDDVAIQSTDAAGGDRLYGMIDYRGLEADMGAGYRPVNHYFDYGPPTTDNTAGGDIEIRSLTARGTFSSQNLELNLLRMPILCGGSCCGGGCCDSGTCDSAGGCDIGCCSTGGSCGSGCGPRFLVTTVFGARYLRIDDDFLYQSVWENTGTAATGFIQYNSEADNHLYGGQIGFNGIYRLGCAGCWALRCSSVVGVFNNHSEVSQRFDVPVGGDVRYVNNGAAPFNITAEEDNIAVLGELRAGVSYRYSCNWSIYGGYRLMGITGLALGFDQIPSSFNSPAQTAYVASEGSIFLHGLQAGVECNY